MTFVRLLAAMALLDAVLACNTGPGFRDEIEEYRILSSGDTAYPELPRAVTFELDPSLASEHYVYVSSVRDSVAHAQGRYTHRVIVKRRPDWREQDSLTDPRDTSFLIPWSEHKRLCDLIGSIEMRDLLYASDDDGLDGETWIIQKGGRGASVTLRAWSPRGKRMAARGLEQFVEAGEAFFVLAGLRADYPEGDTMMWSEQRAGDTALR